MGQIGSTLGNLVGIGQNAGLDTYGAANYGQNYGAQIAAQQANLTNVNQGQTNLLGQLGQIANGNGPNPAQAQLAQATGANVQNQASLAAGQRGAASNVGMIQRQAAQQGRSAQQQAAGQGATMQAQQQLGALGQQSGVLGQQGQQAVGMTGAYESAINSANQINAQTAANAAQFGQGFGGGLLQGVGSMLAGGGEVEPQHYDQGGDVFQFGNPSANIGTYGGDATTPETSMAGGAGSGSSFVGQFLSGAGGNSGQAGSKKNPGLFKSILGHLGKSQAAASNPASGSTSLGSGSSYNMNLSPAGNAMINSPGMAAGNAGYAGADVGTGAAAGGAEAGGAAAAGGGDSLLALAAKGGQIEKLKAQGGHVPGKAKVKGNSYSNDTVKALLSPGEVVIPKSVMESGDPARGAAQFVQAVMAKKRKKA
jgi:hypothetical protein